MTAFNVEIGVCSFCDNMVCEEDDMCEICDEKEICGTCILLCDKCKTITCSNCTIKCINCANVICKNCSKSSDTYRCPDCPMSMIESLLSYFY